MNGHTDECSMAMYRGPRVCICGSAKRRRTCIESGCDEPAGTPWTDYWCARHDEERRARITASLDAMSSPPAATPTEDDAEWAHVIRDGETHEPFLLDDEAVAEVNRALSVYGSTAFLERTWIRPGPPVATQEGE